MRTKKIYDYSFKCSKPASSFSTVNRGHDNEYKRGAYTFSKGIVSIYYEFAYLLLDFVWKGRNHVRSITELTEPMSERQLSIAAGKFAKEIMKNF